MRDKIEPLQADRLEDANSEGFVRFLESRDLSVILRPNNQGPDLCAWLGPRVLLLIGLKTSSGVDVTSTRVKGNRRSTDPDWWWDVHGKISNNRAALRLRAMQALFPSEKDEESVKPKHPDVELIIRVHIIVPAPKETEKSTPKQHRLEKLLLVWTSLKAVKAAPRRKIPVPTCHDVPSLEIDFNEKQLLASGLLPANLHGYITHAFSGETSAAESLAASENETSKCATQKSKVKARAASSSDSSSSSSSSENETPVTQKPVGFSDGSRHHSSSSSEESSEDEAPDNFKRGKRLILTKKQK